MRLSRSKLTKYYYKNVRKRVIMKCYWKNLLFILKKFWRLKIIAFLKWPQNFKIQDCCKSIPDYLSSSIYNKQIPKISSLLVNG